MSNESEIKNMKTEKNKHEALSMFKQFNKDQNEFIVFRTAAFYAIMVLVMPLISLFVLKAFEWDEYIGKLWAIDAGIVAAIGSVCCMHVALFAFLYRCFFINTED